MKKIKSEYDYFYNQITRYAMYGSRFYVRILGRKCADKHTVTLYVRIRHDGERGQIMYSTGLQCKAKQFNARKQAVTIDEINNLIQAEKTRVLKAIYNIRAISDQISLETVKRQISRRQSKETLEEVAQMALQAKQSTTTEQTNLQSKSILNTLIRRLGMAHQPIDTIQPVQLEAAIREVRHLYKRGSLMQSLGLLNNTFETAKKREIITCNPFDRLDRKALLPSDRDKESREPKEYTDIKTMLIDDFSVYGRLALLQLYTGMAFCDTVAIDTGNIKKMGNNYFIINRRKKTNVQFLIPIDDETVNLCGVNGSFRNVQYYNYNNYLKRNFKITTHTLRHARARELLNRGLPLEAVARILGHTSINMTLRYAPLQGRKLSDDEIRMILG